MIVLFAKRQRSKCECQSCDEWTCLNTVRGFMKVLWVHLTCSSLTKICEAFGFEFGNLVSMHSIY